MPNFETLTSASNPLLKQVRRAVRRGGLTGDGYCIAETFHLLEEALRSRLKIGALLVSESAAPGLTSLVSLQASLRVITLADRLFRDLAATETSQGVIALVQPPSWTVDQLFRGTPLVAVLDGLQDPGNAGAIVRAAEAFGASGVIFLKGTVSPYNPKAVRATAGSLFRVPLLHGLEPGGARRLLEDRRLRIYAAAPDGGTKLESADLAGPCAIVIGSEGCGVSEVLLAGSAGIRIPTAGVESLNAAVAAGILLYEARRRREVRP